jgi:hypothetical protein
MQQLALAMQQRAEVEQAAAAATAKMQAELTGERRRAQLLLDKLTVLDDYVTRMLHETARQRQQQQQQQQQQQETTGDATSAPASSTAPTVAPALVPGSAEWQGRWASWVGCDRCVPAQHTQAVFARAEAFALAYCSPVVAAARRKRQAALEAGADLARPPALLSQPQPQPQPQPPRPPSAPTPTTRAAAALGDAALDAGQVRAATRGYAQRRGEVRAAPAPLADTAASHAVSSEAEDEGEAQLRGALADLAGALARQAHVIYAQRSALQEAAARVAAAEEALAEGRTSEERALAENTQARSECLQLVEQVAEQKRRIGSLEAQVREERVLAQRAQRLLQEARG